MTASPSSSAQWHSVTPSTRPLSLSILELTPLALTLSLTLASPFASGSASHASGSGSGSLLAPGSAKRKKRPRKTESDDESTAVEADDEHPTGPGAVSLSGSGYSAIPGSWPSEVGRSFKDLLSHGVVVSVNGQPWSRIVAHASDPDPDESDAAEHGTDEDDWDGDEDWEHAGGKSDEEGAEEGLGSEGIQRRRPRRARFTLSAQTALGGSGARKNREKKERAEKEKDRAVVVVYGLLPGKEYEIELRVVGLGGADMEGSVSNSVLIPPPPAGGLHPRSRANSLRSRQHPRSRSNSTNTPASSEAATPTGRGTPPPPNGTAEQPAVVVPVAPTPVLSASDSQTAQMRHLLSSASAEKEHLSSQIKEARRASQRAEAQLRQEIDAVKKATDKAGTLDLRAKQKALALQEQVKQGWAGAEAAEKETMAVESGMGELEVRIEAVRLEVEAMRSELNTARNKEDEAREKDKKARAEEDKKLAEIVGKVDKLKMKKERKEAEKAELERRIEELDKQREEVERQAEEESKRRGWHHQGYNGAGAHWDAAGGHHHDSLQPGSGHRLTTHPSLSNIGAGAQGGYGAGPAYRPRGTTGYQPRFPSAGAVRPTGSSGAVGGAAAQGVTTAQPSPTHQTSFYPSAAPTTSINFRPPPAGSAQTKISAGPATISGSGSPAIATRTPSGSVTSSGVNAAAAPFVPSSYSSSPSASTSTTGTGTGGGGSSGAYDSAHHTTLMPPGMQHRIYLPSQSSQHHNQNASAGYQAVRPRPTPTFHPPPSVLAEQAAQAQAKGSPTTLSAPAFPPLPASGLGPSAGASVKSPVSTAPAVGGPSLASIVTRAVLSPHSSLAAGGVVNPLSGGGGGAQAGAIGAGSGGSASIGQGSGVGAGGGGRPSPPMPVSPGAVPSVGTIGTGPPLRSPPIPVFAQNQSPATSTSTSTPSTGYTTGSSGSNSTTPAPPLNPGSAQGLGRVTFAPSPSPSDRMDFPPLSPSGPWASLNPSIGSRVRGDSGNLPMSPGFLNAGAGAVAGGGAGTGGGGGGGGENHAYGMIRTQTPPILPHSAWGDRSASPFGALREGEARVRRESGGAGQSRKSTE